MNFLNDNFQRIVEIFEQLISRELEVIRDEAQKNNDNKILNEIKNIYDSNSLIGYLGDMIENNTFFPDFIACYDDDMLIAATYKKYSRVAVFSTAFIVNLIDDFNMFQENLNINEDTLISVKKAIYYIDCMNAITGFARQDESNKHGISLLNAAECYQYISNPSISPDDMKTLGYETKARWKRSFELKAIGKGRHGANLYNLKNMTKFIQEKENSVSVLKLLEKFQKYKEEPSAPF